MTTNTKAKKINWQPEHFPLGTTVTLKGLVHKDGDFIFSTKGQEAVVTVCDIIANGIDSFLIQTEFFNESLGIIHCFNFDHIGSIVKRGTGPVKVVRYRGNSKPVCANAVISDGLINTNCYYFRSDYDIVQYLVSLTTLPSNLYLKEGFFRFLVSQSFVKKTKHEYWHDCFMYSMDKKRARRFIRQNINRWIEPMKVVRARAEKEAKEEQDRYYRDMEDGFDRDFKNDEEPVIVISS